VSDVVLTFLVLMLVALLFKPPKGKALLAVVAVLALLVAGSPFGVAARQGLDTATTAFMSGFNGQSITAPVSTQVTTPRKK